jgi:hypothetical protein
LSPALDSADAALKTGAGDAVSANALMFFPLFIYYAPLKAGQNVITRGRKSTFFPQAVNDG